MPQKALIACGDVGLVQHDGSIAGSLGSKALALSVYLAMESGAHRRDKLASLLWSEFPEGRAKASLRQALTHLRHVLGESLRINRTSVELSGLQSDVLTFLELVDDDPRAAVEIDVPAFLSSLSLKNCPGFEEWAEKRRTELVSRYVEALDKSARHSLEKRDFANAIALAERWHNLDALSDRPVALLMEAHFMGGHPSAAEAIYVQHAKRIAEDSGLLPGRTLVELVARIRDAASTQRRASETWYSDGPVFHANLVGRTEEWQALVNCWHRAQGGDGSIALLEGEPGAGKSRLAEDFLRWVTAHEGVVLRGRGYDASGSAGYATIADVLRSAVSVPGLAGADPQWLASVSQILPELRNRFPGLPRNEGVPVADGGGLLFEAVAQVLLSIADEGPLVVFIDDLEWCDASSCHMVHFLVRRLSEAPILWSMTFTPGGIDRDAAPARLARALRAQPDARVLNLAPLTENDVWHLVRELGRIEEPAGARRLASRIHEVTAGNPFYVIELLKTLFARQVLAVDPVTSRWVVRNASLSSAAMASLTTVHEAIAERIECLDDELHALLITIAVSNGCRPDVLSHVHGISRLRAAVIGDGLVKRQLVTETAGMYACTHPIIANVVRNDLSTSRRREVNRALALALAVASTQENGHFPHGEIARHAELGGEREMACRHALLAAKSSERREAWEEALAWLELAAANAVTAGESEAVNVATARILDAAGRHDAPAIRPIARFGPAVMKPEDLDPPNEIPLEARRG